LQLKSDAKEPFERLDCGPAVKNVRIARPRTIIIIYTVDENTRCTTVHVTHRGIDRRSHSCQLASR